VSVADERFLVTGGSGCIGAWVVRQLVREGADVALLTVHNKLDRLALLLAPDEVARLDVLVSDVNDLETLEQAARRRGVTRIIHLAALQFPFCAADPIAGARVNVQGTLTMFELARRLEIGRIVYASSAAVFGPASHYERDVLPPDAELYPTSHYGTFKVANEHGARVFWDSHGLASIGLRPHSVYGPGRDQGVTSKPTLAMIAAAAGRPYRIDFGGAYQFQFAADVAAWFVAAARAELPGALVFSLPGPALAVSDMVAAIERAAPASRGQISCGDRMLPFPSAFDGRPLETALGARPPTPLDDGVAQTIYAYRDALAAGRLDDAYLERVLAA
jgi:nucleoside-diphosphate-sugar epimerase